MLHVRGSELGMKHIALLFFVYCRDSYHILRSHLVPTNVIQSCDRNLNYYSYCNIFIDLAKRYRYMYMNYVMSSDFNLNAILRALKQLV